MHPLTAARLTALLDYVTHALGAVANNESAPWNPNNYIGYTTEQVAREITYTTDDDFWQGLDDDQVCQVVAIMDAVEN